MARQSAAKSRLNLAVFSTNLGWMGLLGDWTRVVSLTIGHPGPDEVRRKVRAELAKWEPDSEFVEADWSPALRKRLQAYSSGTPDEFADVGVAAPYATDFQRRVAQLTRRIRYGKTLTYGELAEKAGHPRAARAVGTIMSSNRFPIIIPCHRVVASGGKLGGYTSPQGVCLKEHLLAIEAQAIRED